MDDLEIEPAEVKARLARGEQLLLVDVREQWEFDRCRIISATHIPLGQVPSSLTLLAQAGEVVVYCHHGQRSLDAVLFLRWQGIKGVRSMAGGIERWSAEIDVTVPRY